MGSLFVPSSAAVKKIALETGFDLAGIIRPDTVWPAEKIITSWVFTGGHGNMKYMENFTQRREQLWRDFGNVKSMIVLGAGYYTGEDPDGDKARVGHGRVARYAWGKDYHEVIRRKHGEFMQELRILSKSNFKWKSCVDCEPVPEKYCGRQAGLGFIGKHTGLLSQSFGPWFFLSEIVTDLELEPDLPSEGDCGDCALCQMQCPTGALNRDYQMDARLCLAYLTIEHKGIIPRDLRPKVKDRIFGCDECLNVCPYAKNVPSPGWKVFSADQGFGPRIDIQRLFSFSSNTAYEKAFAGTALARVGRKQMLRNACVVLGNSGCQSAVPLLQKALHDISALVRLHAAWGLGQMASENARLILKDRLPLEPDQEVCEEIRFALAGK